MPSYHLRARERRAQAMRMGAGARRVYDWLAMQQMPVTVTNEEDVDVLRNMLAAGLVRGYIPRPILNTATGRLEPSAALVRGLTAEGRRWRAQLYAGPGIAGLTARYAR